MAPVWIVKTSGSGYYGIKIGSVDNCSVRSTYRGLSALSRDLLNNADKPRYVSTLQDLKNPLSTDPNVKEIIFL